MVRKPVQFLRRKQFLCGVLLAHVFILFFLVHLYTSRSVTVTERHGSSRTSHQDTYDQANSLAPIITRSPKRAHSYAELDRTLTSKTTTATSTVTSLSTLAITITTAVETIAAEISSPTSKMLNLSTKTSPKTKITKPDSYLCTSVRRGDHCALVHGLENLNYNDRDCLSQCNNQTFGKEELQFNGDCRFMSGEGRAPVALASLPGSGNTWVRGLLEKATGICTGSVYCDQTLKKLRFNGEYVRGGSVLVVKIHNGIYKWTAVNQPHSLHLKCTKWQKPPYGAMILLVRNPYDALVAEWNRKVYYNNMVCDGKLRNWCRDDPRASHIGTVDQSYFGKNKSWNAHITTAMEIWENIIKHAILESPDNVPKLVVRYEDFQRDRVREVSRVLDFLHFPHSLETLSQRLEEDFSVFHRKRHPQFQAFTLFQEMLIEQTLRKIVYKLSEKGETYKMEEYQRIKLSL